MHILPTTNVHPLPDAARDVDAVLLTHGHLDHVGSLPVLLDGGSAAFREAGHILGSASIELTSPRSRVVFSGDLGRPDTPLLRRYNQHLESGRPSTSSCSSPPTPTATTRASTSAESWRASSTARSRAAVEQLSGLSAHADRTELRAWLDALPDVRRVALHHGEVAAQRAFARWMTAARVPA